MLDIPIFLNLQKGSIFQCQSNCAKQQFECDFIHNTSIQIFEAVQLNKISEEGRRNRSHCTQRLQLWISTEPKHSTIGLLFTQPTLDQILISNSDSLLSIYIAQVWILQARKHDCNSIWVHTHYSITPFYKSGHRASVQNYRFISILCTISKVLEHISISVYWFHWATNLHVSIWLLKKQQHSSQSVKCSRASTIKYFRKMALASSLM